MDTLLITLNFWLNSRFKELRSQFRNRILEVKKGLESVSTRGRIKSLIEPWVKSLVKAFHKLAEKISIILPKKLPQKFPELTPRKWVFAGGVFTLVLLFFTGAYLIFLSYYPGFQRQRNEQEVQEIIADFGLLPGVEAQANEQERVELDLSRDRLLIPKIDLDVEIFTVTQYEVSIENQTSDHVLTLYSCSINGHLDGRVVYRAKLVE